MASSLSKVALRGNPNYKASGIQSYVWLLRKYGFKPTRTGPYQHSLVRNSLAPDPFFARRNPGFWVGGPIKKDKLFFFFNYENLNQTQVVTYVIEEEE